MNKASFLAVWMSQRDGIELLPRVQRLEDHVGDELHLRRGKQGLSGMGWKR